MYEIVILIIGIFMGIALSTGSCVVYKRIESKQEKILELFFETDKITNNDVERILGVSDATATRYLEKLEKKGKIKQIGRTGKHVYYKEVNGSTMSR